MFAPPSPPVDLLIFAQPHTDAAAVVRSLCSCASPSDPSPPLPLITFPAPCTLTIPFSPSPTPSNPSPSPVTLTACLTDVYPVPTLPSLPFHSLVYLHPTTSSSTLALDDARRHLHSITRDRPHLPILILLISPSPPPSSSPPPSPSPSPSPSSSAFSPATSLSFDHSAHCVDLEDAAVALECDKLPNPFHLLPFPLSPSPSDVSAALHWLHTLLYPTCPPSVHWYTSYPFTSLLTSHLPPDLAHLTLSYLTRTTRGTFLTPPQHSAHLALTSHQQRLQLQRQHRKDLLRYLSSYQHHSAVDDSAFVAAFGAEWVRWMHPNSSFAHLDLMRMLWLSMREEGGVRRGAERGWGRLHRILTDDRSRRLLGHWAQQRRPAPLFHRGQGGHQPPALAEWQADKMRREREERHSRRILHTTRWACILQHLANLVLHSHTTHPHHHPPSLLSAEDEAPIDDTSQHPPPGLQPEDADRVPGCWPSFASFLQPHPSLLTLSFVEYFYSPDRLDEDDSWVEVVKSDRSEMVYWLPCLNAASMQL